MKACRMSTVERAARECIVDIGKYRYIYNTTNNYAFIARRERSMLNSIAKYDMGYEIVAISYDGERWGIFDAGTWYNHNPFNPNL